MHNLTHRRFFRDNEDTLRKSIRRQAVLSANVAAITLWWVGAVNSEQRIREWPEHASLGNTRRDVIVSVAFVSIQDKEFAVSEIITQELAVPKKICILTALGVEPLTPGTHGQYLNHYASVQFIEKVGVLIKRKRLFYLTRYDLHSKSFSYHIPVRF